MLLDLEAVKQELKVDIDDDDERIVRTMDQAVEIVLDYMKVASDAYTNTEGDNDFPNIVYASIIRVIISMYYEPDKDPLTPAVVSMLRRLRDPAFA